MRVWRLAMLGVAAVAAVTGWAASPADSPLFWGALPQGTATYKIQIGNQPELFGAIAVNGQYIDMAAFEELLSTQQVTVIVDAPWQPGPASETRIKSSVALRGREIASDRLKRLEAGWAASPYELVSAVDGVRRVERGEGLCLETAQREAQQVEARSSPTPEPTPGETESPVETPRPNPLLLWGPHAVVLVAGLALLALTLRSLVFR